MKCTGRINSDAIIQKRCKCSGSNYCVMFTINPYSIAHQQSLLHDRILSEMWIIRHKDVIFHLHVRLFRSWCTCFVCLIETQMLTEETSPKVEKICATPQQFYRAFCFDGFFYVRAHFIKSDLRWYFEKRDHRSQCGIICSLLLIIYLCVRGREWLAFECALCTDRCDICSSISNERITTLCPGQCQPNYVIIYNPCLPVIGMRVISNHDSHTG